MKYPHYRCLHLICEDGKMTEEGEIREEGRIGEERRWERHRDTRTLDKSEPIFIQ